MATRELYAQDTGMTQQKPMTLRKSPRLNRIPPLRFGDSVPYKGLRFSSMYKPQS
jgi:hypothetical protein